MDVEELPTWLAYPFAAAAPEEGVPGAAAARSLLEATVAYVGLVALATRLHASADGPVTALVEGGWTRTLRALPEGGDAAVTAALELLETDASDANALRDAAFALVSIAPQIARFTLCHLRCLRPDGQRLELRYRALVGTRWPASRVRHLDRQVPLVEGELCLWDGGDVHVPVPRWLGWYDEGASVVRLLTGPDGQGGFVYASTHPAAGPLRLASLPARTAVVAHEVDEPGARTEEFSLEELVGGAPRPPADTRTVARVVNGRSMLAWRELREDHPIVVGRSADHADLVIHHSKVSRRNTQIAIERGVVWVRDLGSTNGTRLRGEPVGIEPTPMSLRDVLQVGPALIRVEQLPVAQIDRFDRILRYSTEPGRDPLTGLLPIDGLVAALERRPDLTTAVVIQVDQLAAISERDRELGETVWVNVARLALLELDEPELCAELAFGELVAAVSGDGPGLADALQEAVAHHAWVPPLEVSLTAAVVRRDPDEPVGGWLDRSRQLAFLGRTRRGPGRVHGVGRG